MTYSNLCESIFSFQKSLFTKSASLITKPSKMKLTQSRFGRILQSATSSFRNLTQARSADTHSGDV